MKKIKKIFSAILAAAVIFGTDIMPVSAFDPPDEGTYIGWEYHDNGWYYTYAEYYEDDEDTSETYCWGTDGVMYVFDKATGYAKDRYNGQITVLKDGTYKYYRDGLPYTGWTKYKNGKKKYYLDGFAVKEDFFIGEKLYGFDKNGFCTGEKSPPAVTAVAEKVTSDADNIAVTVTADDPNGGDYSVGDPEKLERWENGRWVNLLEEDIAFETSDIAVVLSGTAGQCEPNSARKIFSPRHLMSQSKKLDEGYYRTSILCSDLNSGEQYYVRAVFEVLPPVEVKVSEEVYIGGYDRCTEVSAEVKINSDKISPKDVKFDFYKKVTADDYEKLESIDGSLKRKTVKRNGDTYIKISGNFVLDSGYYQAAAEVNEKEYPAYFGAAVPTVYGKGDKNYYSIERDSFDFKLNLVIRNGLSKPIDITANFFSLYMENSKGKYEPIVDYDIDLEPEKLTLAPKSGTELTVDIGRRYNVSELEAGHYLLTVDGLPYYFTVSEK